MRRMKSLAVVVIGVGVGLGVALSWHSRDPSLDATREASNEASNGASNAAFERAASQAQAQLPASEHPRAAIVATAPAGVPDTRPSLQSASRRTASELLDELASIRIPLDAGSAATRSYIDSLLNQLAREGPAAFPALRQFLAGGRDIELGDGVSLRIELFDVIREIGGPEAEQLLLETSRVTPRAAELTVLARLLEELSPGRYHGAVLTSARRLLASGSLEDRRDRDSVYDLLLKYGDASFVSIAQAQLVQPDGTIDPSALRYLNAMLRDELVGFVAATYDDPRITDAASKELLARVALANVGASDQALDVYHKALQDPTFDPDQRRNLVEDLNQDGLSSTSSPTQDDLRIIAQRYALTQAYLQQDYVKGDNVLDAAFREAAKDLAGMLQRAGFPVLGVPRRS